MVRIVRLLLAGAGVTGGVSAHPEALPMGHSENLAAVRAEVQVPAAKRAAYLLEVEVREVVLAMGADRRYIVPFGDLDHQRLPRAV